jgi:hypothetical protein
MNSSQLKIKLARFAPAIFVAWALLSLYGGIYSAVYLWLFQLYGFSRVFSEHLHFVSMPKGGDWIVSNGDRITEGFFIHHFLVAMILWFVFLFTPLPFVFRRKKDTLSDN